MFKPFTGKGMYYEAEHGGQGAPAAGGEHVDAVLQEQTGAVPPSNAVPAGAPEQPAPTAPAPQQQEAQPFQLDVDGQVYDEQQTREAFEFYKQYGGQKSKVDELINANKSIMQALEQQRVAPQQGQQAPLDNQQGLTAEELQQALLDTNPENAYATLQKFVNGMMEEKVTSLREEDEIKTAFLGQNQDYYDVVNSGEFQDFRQKNPFYDEPQAYAFYKLQSAGQQTQEQIDAARQEGEQQAIAHQQAKRGISVLSGQGAPPIQTDEPDFSKMSPQEITQAAAQALIAQRQAAGGMGG
jgi:hypothetical protein